MYCNGIPIYGTNTCIIMAYRIDGDKGFVYVDGETVSFYTDVTKHIQIHSEKSGV